MIEAASAGINDPAPEKDEKVDEASVQTHLALWFCTEAFGSESS
jgi:hypothetical protein